MEAGYFPVMLGVLLIALGLLIAGMAIRHRSAAPSVAAETFALPDWRGCSAIVGGVLCFIIIGAYFGLAPGTFLCVFISALGDRTATLRGAFTLAAIMTAIAVGLFAYALQVQFPILDWP
jgi:hypothetical protein